MKHTIATIERQIRLCDKGKGTLLDVILEVLACKAELQEKRSTDIDLTDAEVSEFLYGEDTRNAIYAFGFERGQRATLKEILGE